MKTIYMTLAAVSALAVAAPLAAQSWNGNRSNVAQLQMQLDTGIERGTITRREAMPLRANLSQLIRMERQFSTRGFSRAERNTLQLRSARLDRQIDWAAQNGNRSAGYDRNDGRGFAENDRRGKDGSRFAENERRADRDTGGKGDYVDNDRRDTRGDRFNGDLRVGQRFSARHTALPMEHRARYRDSDASYYSYDDGRIYQIDRGTGMITAMFTIGS